jgi:hypothetical protein
VPAAFGVFFVAMLLGAFLPAAFAAFFAVAICVYSIRVAWEDPTVRRF